MKIEHEDTYLPKQEVLKDVQREVEKILLKRDGNGVLKDETDYICGAMAVIKAVNDAYGTEKGNRLDDVPVMWQIYPMTGRSIVEELKERSSDDSSR